MKANLDAGVSWSSIEPFKIPRFILCYNDKSNSSDIYSKLKFH